MLNMNKIVVIVHFCRTDFHIAMKWVRWARWLAHQPNASQYDLVMFSAASTESSLVDQMRAEVANWPTAHVEVNPTFYERSELGYAAMANVAFRAALECTEKLFPGRPTLWCESDAIPTRPTWMDEIETEYFYAGKPFMGDFHALGAIPHMTGNAVYPPNWRELAPSIARLPQPRPVQGWDTLCVHETLHQSHHSYRIQQAWVEPMPRITEANASMIHPDTALFHRCKDGSLIDLIGAKMKAPAIPMGSPAIKRGSLPVRPIPGRSEPLVSVQPAIALKDDGTAQKQRTHILITSFRRDYEFTNYCIKSILQYAHGFSGITLLVPKADERYFVRHSRDVNLRTFDERIGKGFLHHMIQVCRADEWCPDADNIVHMDPDCMFWQEATPADFVPNGKCLLVREHYDTIEPRQANRLAWRGCVEAATGETPHHDTMVRHPNVYPKVVYSHLRNIVETFTGMPFDDYVFSRENKFPQGFCEYVSLGTIGVRDFPELFHVVDYDYEQDCIECGVTTRRHQYIYRPNRDKVVEGFSYTVAKYRNDWNKFLTGKLPPFYLK